MFKAILHSLDIKSLILESNAYVKLPYYHEVKHTARCCSCFQTFPVSAYLFSAALLAFTSSLSLWGTLIDVLL